MLVAVTGVSGFIGSETANVLIQRGHSVKGTVRDPDNADKVSSLAGIPGADARLELVQADLLSPTSFTTAFRGCDVVIHVASPYFIDVQDPQRDLVDPALQGTLNVLRAAAGVGVKRVVLTSSVAAVTDEPDGRTYTEDDWNTKSSLTRNPYHYSKTLAEQAAWDFVASEEPSFDLVVINPTGVIGPSIVPGLNTTSQILIDLLKGGVYPVVVDIAFPFVDVRDVAEAHVRAAENATASGRFICSAGLVSMQHTVQVLREHGFGDHKLPRIDMTSRFGTFIAKQAARFQPQGSRSFLETNLGKPVLLDTSKIRDELGMTFRDVDQSIVDTADDAVKWGHVSRA